MRGTQAATAAVTTVEGIMDKLSRKGFFGTVAGLFAAPAVVKAMPQDDEMSVQLSEGFVSPGGRYLEAALADAKEEIIEVINESIGHPYKITKEGTIILWDGYTYSDGWVAESVSSHTEHAETLCGNGTIQRRPIYDIWTAVVVNPEYEGVRREIEITQEQAAQLSKSYGPRAPLLRTSCTA